MLATGARRRRLIAEHGPVQVDTPRDRNGSVEPQIVRKRQRRSEGFDDKILALYARGLSTRDIEAHLAEIYDVKVGRDLISRVTDAVMEDARVWQTRPLEDGPFSRGRFSHSVISPVTFSVIRLTVSLLTFAP